MKDYAAIQTYSSGAFPDVVAVDSSGAATTDGTEYIAAQINNGIFGWQQDIMDYAGLSPDGVIEAQGTGQIKEAYQKGNGVGPGMYVQRAIDDTPAVHGDRVILLTSAMQGVLIATYPELVAAVYVGDANNATAPYFYKSTDAAGLTRNTAGTYLQLPPQPDGGMLFKSYTVTETGGGGDVEVAYSSGGGSLVSATGYMTVEKSSDGKILLSGHVDASTSSVNRTSFALSISGGFTFVGDQSLSFDIQVAGAYARGSLTNAGTNIFSINTATFSSPRYLFGLNRVEISSWPTWADDFKYQWGITY